MFNKDKKDNALLDTLKSQELVENIYNIFKIVNDEKKITSLQELDDYMNNLLAMYIITTEQYLAHKLKKKSNYERIFTDSVKNFRTVFIPAKKSLMIIELNLQ